MTLSNLTWGYDYLGRRIARAFRVLECSNRGPVVLPPPADLRRWYRVYVVTIRDGQAELDMEPCRAPTLDKEFDTAEEAWSAITEVERSPIGSHPVWDADPMAPHSLFRTREDRQRYLAEMDDAS